MKKIALRVTAGLTVAVFSLMAAPAATAATGAAAQPAAQPGPGGGLGGFCWGNP